MNNSQLRAQIAAEILNGILAAGRDLSWYDSSILVKRSIELADMLITELDRRVE